MRLRTPGKTNGAVAGLRTPAAALGALASCPLLTVLLLLPGCTFSPAAAETGSDCHSCNPAAAGSNQSGRMQSAPTAQTGASKNRESNSKLPASSLLKERNFLEARSASADRLIADGTRLVRETRLLAANAETPDAFGLYESLFNQYQDALARYKQHRREYFEHVQQYHNTQSQPESIYPNSNPSQSNNDQNSPGSLQALKYAVEDKCAQLQQLETTIISNERQLEAMVASLRNSQQKESQAIFSSNWTAASGLAAQNSSLVAQFNHMAMMKNAQVFKSVSSLIAEANRDGAYNAHMQAYKDFSQSNGMEVALNKRSNMHGQVATMVQSQLAAMRPEGLSMPALDPNRPAVTADQLQQESNALDSEYANVQDLFAKLESVRKSMPPSLPGTKGHK